MQKEKERKGTMPRTKYGYTESVLYDLKDTPTLIDMTGPQKGRLRNTSSRRQSKKMPTEKGWVGKQMNIFKNLRLLLVHLDFADEDLVPKPCLWVEWYNEMDESDGVQADDNLNGKNGNLRCWRMVMTLILSRYVDDEVDLKQTVFILYTSKQFSPGAIRKLSTKKLAKLLATKVDADPSPRAAADMKDATKTILDSGERSSTFQQQVLKYSEGQACDTHVVKIAMALGWADPQVKIAHGTQFGVYKKVVQEQLLDWLPQQKLAELNKLLATLGQYMNHMEGFSKLKHFVSEVMRDQEQETVEMALTEIEKFYNSTESSTGKEEKAPRCLKRKAADMAENDDGDEHGRGVSGPKSHKTGSGKTFDDESGFMRKMRYWCTHNEWEGDFDKPSHFDLATRAKAILMAGDDTCGSNYDQLYNFVKPLRIQGLLDSYKVLLKDRIGTILRNGTVRVVGFTPGTEGDTIDDSDDVVLHGHLTVSVRTAHLLGLCDQPEFDQQHDTTCTLPYEDVAEELDFPPGALKSQAFMNTYIEKNFTNDDRLPKAVVVDVVNSDKNVYGMEVHISLRKTDLDEWGCKQ
jgi:hypothetical protein